MKLATEKDLMTCCYCRRSYKPGQEVYMMSDGWSWKGVVIFCDKCRKKYYPKKPITPTT